MIKTARAYLWRAFLTDRYRSSAASLLKGDFDGLRKVMTKHGNPKKLVPIWSQSLPNERNIVEASWPTRSSLSRALLAVSIRRGARDIGSGEEVKEELIKGCEYHHLFPEAYLGRNSVETSPHRAMNCVLIRGRTNKEAADKAPLAYLRTLVVAQSGSKIGKEDLERRLDSHLVKMDLLKIQRRNVQAAYQLHLAGRARRVLGEIKALVEGRDP